MNVVFDKNESIPKGTLISVILRNASKSGVDEVIARALLPVHFLIDQKKHSYWLKFHPPTGFNFLFLMPNYNFITELTHI